MIRDLSAIGLSRYTTQQSLHELVDKVLKEGPLRASFFTRGETPYAELIYTMGPFELIVRGESVPGSGKIGIDYVLPSLREKRGVGLLQSQIHEKDEGRRLFIVGQEAHSMEEVDLEVTEIHRYFTERDVFWRSPSMVSCYGMSVEGKILLGTYRSREDEVAIRDEEEWRRDMMSRAYAGDEEALQEILEDESRMDEEVRSRLKNEDIYSIFDGFMMPAEGEENTYHVLGDIIKMDKFLNPLSEEWVFYLELNVLGQLLRVLINPIDLVGEAALGRRFQGKVKLYGRLDPARMLLEGRDNFY